MVWIVGHIRKSEKFAETDFSVILKNSIRLGRLTIIFQLHLKPVVYTGFRGWGGSREQWGEGTFYIGEMKKFSFPQTRKFSKNLNNQRKIYNFLKIVKEILRFSECF